MIKTEKILEFVDYSQKYDTEKLMYKYFEDLLESHALAKFTTPTRYIIYIREEMQQHLLDIKGFEEKVKNFITIFNKKLLNQTYEELIQYDLHDAFVNRTDPIIKNIVLV